MIIRILLAKRKATVGMFDNSYFDNSKSDKTDYVRRLEGLVFEKKSDIIYIYRERENMKVKSRNKN